MIKRTIKTKKENQFMEALILYHKLKIKLKTQSIILKTIMTFLQEMLDLIYMILYIHLYILKH